MRVVLFWSSSVVVIARCGGLYWINKITINQCVLNIHLRLLCHNAFLPIQCHTCICSAWLSCLDTHHVGIQADIVLKKIVHYFVELFHANVWKFNSWTLFPAKPSILGWTIQKAKQRFWHLYLHWDRYYSSSSVTQTHQS